MGPFKFGCVVTRLSLLTMENRFDTILLTWSEKIRSERTGQI